MASKKDFDESIQRLRTNQETHRILGDKERETAAKKLADELEAKRNKKFGTN